MIKKFRTLGLLVVSFLSNACVSVPNGVLISDYNRALNDLRNLQTFGYKDSFQDSLKQGNLLYTGNNLDLALVGNGFLAFSQEGSDSLVFTRNGSLLVDAQDRVVNSEGLALFPPLKLSPGYDRSTIKITTEGEFHYQTSGGNTITERLIAFKSLGGETKRKEAFFIFANFEKTTQCRFQGGYLETSNVSLLEKLLTMGRLLTKIKSEVPGYDNLTFQIKLIEELRLFSMDINRTEILPMNLAGVKAMTAKIVGIVDDYTPFLELNAGSKN